MSEYINKIKIGNTEYDIQASSIGTVSEINITNNTEALVNLTTGSGAGIKTGKIGVNSNGNLSVESLSKHVNIEAEQSIQLKPVNSIIVDTTRKLKRESQNEANIKVVYDDYIKDGSPADQDPYGYLKIHSRAIDLRCYGHGGIALQPCGHDGSNHENKIKFESDRKVSANDTVNPNTDYSGEGGKGVEFGTFNNEHTSIFTKDYRFNEDGKVYSVTRGNVTINSNNKSDYPTQNDDFKDILRTNKDTNCNCSSDGVWSVSDPSKEYIMGATWKSIVKTANALNDRDWTDTNISNKGNLQITTSDEIEWVEVTGYEGESITLAANKQDPKRSYVDDGNVYKLSDNKYYICQFITNGEHHLNLEADNTIKVESKFNDVELNAGDKVQATASIVQLEATEKIDFSTTPTLSLMARKITKNGGYESSNAKLQITSLNNFGRTVYENSVEEYVRIPYTTLYSASGEFIPPIINIEKISVFESDRSTPKAEGSYIVKNGNFNLLVVVESGGKLKKKASVCDNSLELTLYTDSAANTEFKLDPSTNYDEIEPPTLYTSANTTATEGYYIARTLTNARHIIYIGSNHKLSKFDVNNNGPGNSYVQGWYIDGSKQIVGDYSGIQFGGNEEAGTNENAIQNGEPLTVGNMECNINDIITLVDYFKNGAGRNNGPWNS